MRSFLLRFLLLFSVAVPIGYLAKYYGSDYVNAKWNFGLNPLSGYDETKQYYENLSAIDSAIIPLVISIRKKDEFYSEEPQMLTPVIPTIATSVF